MRARAAASCACSSASVGGAGGGGGTGAGGAGGGGGSFQDGLSDAVAGAAASGWRSGRTMCFGSHAESVTVTSRR